MSGRHAAQSLDGIQATSPSQHTLDEHAVNSEPLQTLMTALERHKSTKKPTDHDLSPTGVHAGQNSKEDPITELLNPPTNVPGVFVDPNESVGLPGSTDTSMQAAQLVESHATKPGSRFALWKRKKVAIAEDKPPVKARDFASPFTSSPNDVEKNAGQPQAPGGILSALLTLYNAPKVPYTGASTPASAVTLSDEPMEDGRISRTSTYSSLSTSQGNSPKDHIGGTHTSSSLSLFGIGSRPTSTASGAGVFGPLIASTGNLSGMAAPTPSQLQPSIKRPGYHLSRYSYEDAVLLRSKGQEKNRKSVQLEMSPLITHEPPSSRRKASKNRWSVSYADGTTPDTTPNNTDVEDCVDKKWAQEKEKRRKRKKAEVYITRHVAEILQRQEFILKFTRAMMAFGGPSHRLQSQIQSTARVLELNVACMYLPDVMLISFDDNATATSQVKLIRQSSCLDLGKLNDAYQLYWKVIHDDIFVSEASAQLDSLMCKPQLYNWWQLMLIGGMCSSSICTVSFSGSFIDALIVFPFGALLVGIQLLSVRNELYSNVFEITVATLFSFLSAVLASTHRFCYSAIASSAIVLILPGYLVLSGSLDLLSRNVISGSVRMCYAVVYSLFLGFGLAMGGEAYESIFRKPIRGTTDYQCSAAHDVAIWYQKTPSQLWAFLTIPMFSLFLSMRNQTPWQRKEMFLVVAISCVGWVTNHFTSLKFANQNNMSAAVGAFTVGVVSNLCARFISGNAFVIMITGILFQVPSGLGSGGLFGFVSEQSSGSPSSYVSGFHTGLQIIFVGISLAVGLGISLFLAYPIQSRRRAGGIFSL